MIKDSVLQRCLGLLIKIVLKNLNAAFTPHFVFSLTGAAKKHIIGEKPLDKQAVFQGRWGGIGGDRVQSENL